MARQAVTEAITRALMPRIVNPVWTWEVTEVTEATALQQLS